MTVDLAVALPTLVAGLTLIALLVGGLVKVRKWIEGVAQSSRQTQEQLTTTDDKTIADHVQESSREIAKINGHVRELMQTSEENRHRSIRAETLAELAHDRIDKHLANDHGFHLSPKNHEEI